MIERIIIDSICVIIVTARRSQMWVQDNNIVLMSWTQNMRLSSERYSLLFFF